MRSRLMWELIYSNLSQQVGKCWPFHISIMGDEKMSVQISQVEQLRDWSIEASVESTVGITVFSGQCSRKCQCYFEWSITNGIIRRLTSAVKLYLTCYIFVVFLFFSASYFGIQPAMPR